MDPEKKNILTIAPQNSKTREVTEKYLYCMHISASMCGKYFIGDGWYDSQAPIYIGSLITGKFRTLCLSGTSCGSPQYTHAHPYLTADNKHVIFNSDRTGIPQVYAATVPEDFLKSLD